MDISLHNSILYILYIKLSLENYFKTNYIQYDKQDICAFFHASDRDEDNKISIVEFNYVIKPFHPS